MRGPESLRRVRPFDKLRRPAREIDADERSMAKDVAQLVPELVAHFENALVRRPAIGARVAAVLNERDRRVGAAEEMVARIVDRAVEPVGARRVAHRRILSPAARAGGAEQSVMARS